ncbi:hypothetical protein Tco_0268257 [Tanacetum coccineum]
MSELLWIKKQELQLKAVELEIRRLENRQRDEALYESTTDEELKALIRQRLFGYVALVYDFEKIVWKQTPSFTRNESLFRRGRIFQPILLSFLAMHVESANHVLLSSNATLLPICRSSFLDGVIFLFYKLLLGILSMIGSSLDMLLKRKNTGLLLLQLGSFVALEILNKGSRTLNRLRKGDLFDNVRSPSFVASQ